MPQFKHQYFGGDTYSQHGEDLAVVALFHHMRINKPTYIDIGAHHPWDINNTALLYKRGSRGVCVDANRQFKPIYKQHRPEDVFVCAAVVGEAFPGDKMPLHRASMFSGINSIKIENLRKHPHMDTIEVDAITLPQIVEKYAGGKWPDFLSIDAEGCDLEILYTVDAEKASVICVEALSPMGDVTAEIIEWCMFSNFRIHSWHGGNALLISGRLRDLAYGGGR